MPRIIKPKTIQPKIQEIGRLRKGGEKRKREKNGREFFIFGEDLDYFRFEPNELLLDYPPATGGYSNLHEELAARYQALGEKPRQIKIRFPYPNIEQVWRCTNEVWKEVKGVGVCQRRCDGQTCTMHLDERGNISRQPIPCAAGEEDDECPMQCKAKGQLSFFIPELEYPGVVTLTTHSLRDIGTIAANLEAWRWADLREFPFLLCRTEQPFAGTDPKTGQTFTGKKWFVHLEIHPQFGTLLLQSQERRSRHQLMAQEYAPSLPEGRTVETNPEPSKLVRQLPQAQSFRDRILAAKNQTGHTNPEIVAIASNILKRPITKAEDIKTEAECIAVIQGLLNDCAEI